MICNCLLVPYLWDLLLVHRILAKPYVEGFAWGLDQIELRPFRFVGIQSRCVDDDFRAVVERPCLLVNAVVGEGQGVHKKLISILDGTVEIGRIPPVADGYIEFCEFVGCSVIEITGHIDKMREKSDCVRQGETHGHHRSQDCFFHNFIYLCHLAKLQQIFYSCK